MMRFDFVDMSRATVTPEGWIRDKPVLTRSGIFEYRRADGTVQREYRPPEEVFHADHIASIRGVPITDGHPGRVHADNADAIVGAVLTNGEQQDGNLLAEVVIHAPKRLGAKKELSLGYSLELDETPGEVDGKRYDAVQRKLRVNHLAVVQRGRAGNAKLRLDREDAADAAVKLEEEDNMADLKLVTVRVDSIDYQAQPEVARALDRANEAIAAEKTRADAAIKAEKTRADSLEAERDSLKAAAAKHADDLKKAREDAAEGVKVRLTLEGIAKKHSVEFKADASDRAVREAVITKLAPKTYNFDGKSDDYVAFAFDREAAEADRVAAAAGGNRALANGGGFIAPPAARADAAPTAGAPAPFVRSSAELRQRLGRAG